MMLPNRIDSNRNLPEPDSDALKHSKKLASIISSLISANDGAIGFDEYMQACLYQPGLGYYSAGSQKFGVSGDFITAPELSSLFSKCLAVQCSEVIKNIENAVILELGAGSGRMACEILKELDKQNSLPDEYWILELSADLRQRQQQLVDDNIPDLKTRVRWLDKLPDKQINGLILANEVMDALPVKRFIKIDENYFELKVKHEDEKFDWTKAVADESLSSSIKQLESDYGPFSNGYVSEMNLRLGDWINTFSKILNAGVMLLIDYGYSGADYYSPTHKDGTLLCHYRHRVHSNPFFYPGLQDITSSINFTAVAENADRSGMNVSGYTTQAYFLMACGLEKFIGNLNELDTKSQAILSQELRTLTMPDEMGEKFKFIGLTSNYDKSLLGFSVRDQRVYL